MRRFFKLEEKWSFRATVLYGQAYDVCFEKIRVFANRIYFLKSIASQSLLTFLQE